MKYRNRVTGAVIEASCLISGGNWEPVPALGAGSQTAQTEPAQASQAETPKKRSRKKTAAAEK